MLSQTLHDKSSRTNCIHRKYQGHSVDELPFKAAFGIWGSYICAFMNFICLTAQFYVALWPVGGPNLDPTTFFQAYLAGPFLLILYIGWKGYSWFYRPEERPLYVKIKDIDIYSGMREGQMNLISGPHIPEDERRGSILALQDEKKKRGAAGWAKAAVQSVF
jgi:amino acid transporter